MLNSEKNGKQSYRKLHVFQCYSKIQQAKPAFYSDLVNKQLGYDVLIELQDPGQTLKVQNCICSARPNSQVYKRFAKKFLSNLKACIDELYIFCGYESMPRLQTSIGFQSNPGLFLILGLAFLDQKYKDSHQKYDVEVSFMEYREGCMYDLLNYTEKPLKPYKSTSDPSNVFFNESAFNISTFNQFVKLFKVALFNNKERDFKSQATFSKLKSTFIMRVKNKIYDQNNILLKEQQTLLIDFQQNCMNKDQGNDVKEKSGSKTLWDYILIEINNRNPNNKFIHYHLVEENHLLLLIKKMLNKKCNARKNDEQQNCLDSEKLANLIEVNGQITIINAMSANKRVLNEHLGYLQGITNAINNGFQGKVAIKSLAANKKLNDQLIHNHLKSIIRQIQRKSYPSLRNFNMYKLYFVKCIKKCKLFVKEYLKIIKSYLLEKISCKFMQNEFIAYEISLIGNCVKSDHFKDFYNAKSYLLLNRQINIKTEQIKEQIQKKRVLLNLIEQNFFDLKKKESENTQKIIDSLSSKIKPKQVIKQKTVHNSSYASNSSLLNNFKFSKILTNLHGTQQFQLCPEQFLIEIIRYIYSYIYDLWEENIFVAQRTIFDEIAFQDIIKKQQNRINKIIDEFIEQIQSLKETDINFQQQNNKYHQNQLSLLKSKDYFCLIQGKNKNRPKRYLIERNSESKPEPPAIKLPNLRQIIVSGNIKLVDLLLNPFQ